MELENGIIYSEKATVNGVEGYMIQQEGMKEPMFMPVFIQKNDMTYELEPTQGLYYAVMEYTTDEEEKKMLEEPVGTYGKKWQEFMQEHYPEEVVVLKVKCRWEILSRQIDKEAWEMHYMIKDLYKQKNPPPTGNSFFENLKYNETMSFYINHEVMEQIVLQLRTE